MWHNCLLPDVATMDMVLHSAPGYGYGSSLEEEEQSQVLKLVATNANPAVVLQVVLHDQQSSSEYTVGVYDPEKAILDDVSRVACLHFGLPPECFGLANQCLNKETREPEVETTYEGEDSVSELNDEIDELDAIFIPLVKDSDCRSVSCDLTYGRTPADAVHVTTCLLYVQPSMPWARVRAYAKLTFLVERGLSLAQIDDEHGCAAICLDGAVVSEGDRQAPQGLSLLVPGLSILAEDDDDSLEDLDAATAETFQLHVGVWTCSSLTPQESWHMLWRDSESDEPEPEPQPQQQPDPGFEPEPEPEPEPAPEPALEPEPAPEPEIEEPEPEPEPIDRTPAAEPEPEPSGSSIPEGVPGDSSRGYDNE